MNRDDLLAFLRTHKSEFERDYGVVRIGLFGSYASGNPRNDSDIDIAVELRREHKADNYFRLLHFLEDSLRKKIDLGVESALRPAVRESIKNTIIYV